MELNNIDQMYDGRDNSDRQVMENYEDDYEYDDDNTLNMGYNRGPLGTRSRGVLPPQEVFKNIIFDSRGNSMKVLKADQPRCLTLGDQEQQSQLQEEST